ncbi:MAG: hypothetical protein HOE59_06960, partial [Euryarchaeota archaeon]|nr:hypothetical protein [Euryarchaeota archaeon]
LNLDGWDTIPYTSSTSPNVTNSKQQLLDSGADTLVTLVLNEWYFSINLNWVTAFNFDTDADIYVQSSDEETPFVNNVAERDVIDEEANDSPQNKILAAYRDQLIDIFDDSDIRAAIE